VAALRLFRFSDASLLNGTDMGAVYTEHETLGYVNYSRGEW
jgi:hypothetical protein